MRTILFFVLIALCLSGCATAGVTMQTGVPYSGTIYDVTGIIHLTLNPLLWLLKIVYALDLPFTIVGDTLLLPFFIL